MRIKDLFVGKRRVLTPLGIKKMGRLHDVEGLVEVIDQVDRSLQIYVLDELVTLSEKNRFDRMIEAGVIGKLLPIFQKGEWKERKRAALLISSFILHNRLQSVLKHDWTMKALITQLPEADDVLRKNISYCIYEFCRRNMGHQVVYHNGIPAIVESMRADDPDIQYWALFSMSCIASLGYQELILKTDLLPMLNKALGSMDGEVHSLASVLRDDLYNWRDIESKPETGPDEHEQNVKEGYEDLGVTDGYYRPEIKTSRPIPVKGTRLTSQGSKVRDIKEDDVEIILDIDELEEENNRPKTSFVNPSEEDEDEFVIEM